MNKRISIIIPCYNSKSTLEATLQSVIEQDSIDWEAIIVNDGSTDNTEEIALKWVGKDKRFKYYSKQNEGLGKTRNFGINKATGTYILPLDSDNLIEKDFGKTALKVFENNLEIDVVHGYAEYFGEKEGIWKIDDFNLQKMLVHNYIDACAIYKKELWQKVGGYDEDMPFQGHEDWEFWLALSTVNARFYNLNKITFKYFVSSSSMIRSFNIDMIFLNQDYIVKKYSKLYYDNYCREISQSNKIDKKYLKSRKIVIDLFCKTFFGFSIFKTNTEILE
ncbi:glycosyltransferase family 2 protein [Flavobacterium sp. MR2016-29]|uniref:glycosyltransferase family 2 protein n=1 Tax=Flavobacterium sp. MR2016-29 TaxID=2783795 RepID=UPI00188CBF03|nr:glycosyltransferase family A protein [Flavobacterium sp. MR2016-29]MBF4492885.1 glycosyltransferase family 2 protein [Flavobacterium sp. MR2016-29]